MTHRLATNYAKNYCNRTPIVKVIVENVVTCFWGTQCIYDIMNYVIADPITSLTRLGNSAPDPARAVLNSASQTS